MKTDIVILDSGVSYETINLGESQSGFSIYVSDGKTYITNDIQDEIGHGTAIYSIIHKFVPLAEILNIKLFDKNEKVEEEILLAALIYIRDNVSCKIINLSCGLIYCKNNEKLEKICMQLYQQGTIIVAAFDNNGCCSFPAAFKKVIGVDGNNGCKKAYDFEFVEGDLVNVRAKGGFQKVKWKGGKTILLGGSSFACAYVTAYIANLYLKKRKDLNFESALYELKKQANKVYREEEYKNIYTGVRKDIIIKSAAVFPFNKEMHSIIRYAYNLNYKIKAVYDIRQLGKIGAGTNQILKLTEVDKNYVIEDIKNINYKNIDYLIIGHLEEVNNIIGRDIRKELIENCIKNNVNIYSFDPLEYCMNIFDSESADVFWPSVHKWNIPQNTFGKLYGITKPVVGFFGTSSCQGKFTLQITIKKLFEQMNYKVGTIGTEPQALLLGMDFVYPMGYNSGIHINDYEAVILLNKMCYELCNKYDIVMVASQANTIPYNCMNISSFHIKQHSFLIGTQPDVIVLCINYEDDIEYINNTIKYLEGCVNCKVIAAVLFPLKLRNDWRGLFDSRILISHNEYFELLSIIKEKFNINVYRLGNDEDMSKLRDSIICYFSV